jgi:hypothetical protein
VAVTAYYRNDRTAAQSVAIAAIIAVLGFALAFRDLS